MTDVALILFGNGAELGNFRFFADDHANELIRKKTFAQNQIITKKTFTREDLFLSILDLDTTKRIREVHIFSHSIGGGLFLGYREASADLNRSNALDAFPSPYVTSSQKKITYEQVLLAETGAILTDHLTEKGLQTDRPKYRSKFARGAFMKLWGCNSAVSGWVYKDPAPGGVYVASQAAPADYYYWRALNTKNSPKPSIAQALADYFGIDVYGAGSGSHIEVQHKGRWVKPDEYRRATGKSAGEPQVLRLHPDHGDYARYSPRNS